MSVRERSGVFISYSRQEAGIANSLRKRLEAAKVGTIWQDLANLEGGVGWWQQITEAIDRSEFMVLIASSASIQSTTVRSEWRYARQVGVCVYPVLAERLNFDTLPRWMRETQFYDLELEWDKFLQHLKRGCQELW